MSSEKKTFILKLDRDNPGEEIGFELRFLKSLTVDERFELMFQRNSELLEQLERHGHKRSDTIIKRS